MGILTTILPKKVCQSENQGSVSEPDKYRRKVQEANDGQEFI